MTVFLGIFGIMGVWELVAPRRDLVAGKAGRWFGNLSIILLNTVLVRLIFPVIPVAMAVLARAKGWGILNYFNFPSWLEVIVAVLLLDLTIYLQHVMFHTLPLLWRLHLVHHADLDIDVTTGLRFHPVEIVLSMVIKLAAVSVIGPQPLAVVFFEVLLNGMAMFNHGNVRMPGSFDRALRYLLVTPDMHRVHHSVNIRETNSNFGFNLSWWDVLFGTYRERPAAGHEGMVIGLAQYRSPDELTLPRLIILPVTADPGGYAINRRGRDPEAVGSARTIEK
ncbi:MAG: hypothetical protein A2176_01290 [Spirochaetes bacterium RBG_13_51_14]|nr:MAG: hypothetical protein A2176_01290 [Spirochaetes bacterium RBG_13_51_14]